MIAHHCVDPKLWPEVSAVIYRRPRPGMKVHHFTHTPTGICIETSDPASTALARQIIRHAVMRRIDRRHQLKKQLISRRPTK